MTVTEIARFQQKCDHAKNLHSVPQLSNNSLPSAGYVNPYGAPGMDITGTTSADRKTVPVDEGVVNKLKDLAMQIMAEGNGIDTGFGVNETINAYVMTLPPEDRINAGWTLNEIFHKEAVRLGDYVHQHDPSWNWGDPFDKSILEGYQRGMDITV